MQQAVIERILNRDDKLSLLSLSVQLYGEAHISSTIPAVCFYPQPEVDLSVLIIDIFEQLLLSGEGIDGFIHLSACGVSSETENAAQLLCRFFRQQRRGYYRRFIICWH